MLTPDDLTPDAFARLTALEQSQELLRRAQFLDASSRARHADALDRHQAVLDAHEAAHIDHAFRMAHLETLIDRQQDLQVQVQALTNRLADRQDLQAARQEDHASRMARLEDIAGRIQLTLDAVLEMLRHRNGH